MYACWPHVTTRGLLSSLVLGLVVGCGPETDITSDEGELIHGSDQRHDVYSHPDQRLRDMAAQSIVALVPNDRIERSNPRDITFDVPTLGEERDLCEGERFADDPAIASCSGTLVSEELVLTAAHC